MKLYSIKRETKLENVYHKNMGTLKCKYTKIYKTIFGIKYKTIYKYRETYHGEIKDVNNINKSII